MMYVGNEWCTLDILRLRDTKPRGLGFARYKLPPATCLALPFFFLHVAKQVGHPTASTTLRHSTCIFRCADRGLAGSWAYKDPCSEDSLGGLQLQTH